jgi:hypothetical protein
MESNRAITRFAVGTYALLGLIAVAVLVLTGHPLPIIVWALLPLGCLLAVLVQFAIVGPLMLLTAWATEKRDPRQPVDERGEE